RVVRAMRAVAPAPSFEAELARAVAEGAVGRARERVVAPEAAPEEIEREVAAEVGDQAPHGAARDVEPHVPSDLLEQRPARLVDATAPVEAVAFTAPPVLRPLGRAEDVPLERVGREVQVSPAVGVLVVPASRPRELL